MRTAHPGQPPLSTHSLSGHRKVSRWSGAKNTSAPSTRPKTATASFATSVEGTLWLTIWNEIGRYLCSGFTGFSIRTDASCELQKQDCFCEGRTTKIQGPSGTSWWIRRNASGLSYVHIRYCTFQLSLSPN